MGTTRVKTIHDRAYQLLVDLLHEARQRAAVTQTDLAARLRTDQSYVSKYERAERRLDVIEVRAICKELDLEFREFIAQFEKELRQRGLA